MSKNLLIEGPTVKGTFFIKDAESNVWDGKSMRGFGAAEEYPTFQEAFSKLQQIKPPSNKTV